MTDLQSFTLMMASTQVVKTSVNTNNSPSQDYTINPDDHSNHNIDSPGFKPFTVIVNFLQCGHGQPNILISYMHNTKIIIIKGWTQFSYIIKIFLFNFMTAFISSAGLLLKVMLLNHCAIVVQHLRYL